MSQAELALPLDEADRKELLRIARATLREHLATGYLPPGAPHRKTLLQPAAAYVTIKVAGVLRGCMGRVEADRPLYLVVEELTVAAVSGDPRFEPVRLEELSEARVTISILSALEPCALERVEIGRHGLVVTRGPRRGLILPITAVENGWSAERLLDEACGKAGLGPGAWRDPDTRVEQFTADRFSETD